MDTESQRGTWRAGDGESSNMLPCVEEVDGVNVTFRFHL